MTIPILSDGVLNELLAFLSVEDLLTLESTDRTWRHTLANGDFWTSMQLNNGELAPKVIREVAQRHGDQVKRIKLVGCVIPKGAIIEAAKQFVSVTHLDASGSQTLEDEDFTALVRASTQQLVEVRAVKCLRLTDAALQVVGELHAQSLQRINFSYCRQISDDGVTALVQHCSRLQSVKLKGCPAVTTSVVIAIAESCPELDTLLVGGARNLTDDALRALADHCPRLSTLDISRSNPFGLGRGGVSNAGLVYLAASCSVLKHLILAGQGRLSHSVLGSLASSCPELTTLDIGGCCGIVANPIALGVQLQHMNCLHELSVAFTRGLKGEHIDFIASQCPQLKEFRVDGASIAPPYA